MISFPDVAEEGLPGSYQRRRAFDPTDWRRFAGRWSSVHCDTLPGSLENRE